MTDTILPRKLWYFDALDHVVVDEGFLQTHPSSLVVLGEAGMGKSTLLGQLASADGYAFCTARMLVNSPDPAALFGTATTLVIDALDEVSAQRNGDAVDLVIRKLGELEYPRFILSCRVADWRSATALQGISDFYQPPPLEVHLAPLDRADAAEFLSRRLGRGEAEKTIKHFEERGLSGLWSNPQTLELVEKTAGKGTLPDSKGELFVRATALLQAEHREEKAGSKLTELAEANVLDAIGASFAALILTGAEALSRRVNNNSENLPIREVAALPFAAAISDILDSRLFAALGTECFSYTHRAIGEFLGARWLARNADTPRKRRRLLELFNTSTLVPASLRGIHGWLAWHSPALAPQVIANDPMGVVEYGDADNLSLAQARTLFTALNALARENPRFHGWTEYRVGGLIKAELLPDIRDALTDQTVEFGLKLLILQGLKRSKFTAELADTLRLLVLDADAGYSNRAEAGARLAALDVGPDWRGIIEALLAKGDEDSVRLAAELLEEISYADIGADLIFDVVMAQLSRTESSIGIYLGLQRKLPAEHLDSLLDKISAEASKLGDQYQRPHNAGITDLAYGLLARRLDQGKVDVSRLWSWLRPFSSTAGYHRETRESVADFFAKNEGVRRALLSLVLLEQPGEKNVWQRFWRLNERAPGLNANEEDVIWLLGQLDSADDRWRDLVQLVRHSPTEGGAVRAAAARFAGNDPQIAAWLDGLSTPPKQDWEIEQEARKRKEKEDREKQWQQHRLDFGAHIDAIRAGEYGWVLSPAKAYLALFYDIGDKESDGPERVEKWLGPELRDASLTGFEAFLKATPPHPTASDMAESYAQGRRWEAASIVVAALAERQRTGRGFDDLSDERLMAGFFETRNSRIDEHAGIASLHSALEDALRIRGAWETTQRLFIEPQLSHRREYVDGLYTFMREARDAELSASLAVEWLERFPDMAVTTETELIDRLLAFPDAAKELRRLAALRVPDPNWTAERRLAWTTVALILDFERSRTEVETSGLVDRDLFWQMRERLGYQRHDDLRIDLHAPLLAWMIRTFRPLIPMVGRPKGDTSGNSNPWDASEFLGALIRRLADDVSGPAMELLVDLRDAPEDGYTWQLRVAAAEQRRKRVEADWIPPEFEVVAAAVADEAPNTSGQLQAVVVEALDGVQALLRGSDVDWYRDFFNAGVPRKEDDCRDTILKMLRPLLPFGIQAFPEGHLADDKRCDIVCVVGDAMVPIEVKGQWHRDLWTAADRQLDRLYVNDHRAKRGIYLVLWFGNQPRKRLQSPPSETPLPQTAEELRAALRSASVTTRDGRTEVIVLDVTRPG